MTPAPRERTTIAVLAALLAVLLLACAAPAAHAATGDPLDAFAPELVDPSIAPVMSVGGQTVFWTSISGVTSYVFVRKESGKADQYTTLTKTAVTPVASPGKTVHFSVRTNIAGSVWAREVTITYGTTSPPPPPSVPVLSVSGQTLSWTPISGVSSYVLARKLTGQADQYSTIAGTSTTPAPSAGKTVRFSVRTNATGSAWSNEVSIAYPESQPPPPPPPPPPPAGGFVMGLTAGSDPMYELPYLGTLGARTARLIYDIGTSASSIATTMDAYASAGIRPLLTAHFYGRLPTTAESQNVATWARAYGPGGTFWQGKSYPANTAVDRIEFGHETSYSYQWSDNSPTTYANRARTYAQRFKEAQIAVQAANPNVGLLAQGDNAVNQDAWVVNMFRAVPDLGQRAAGWTIHPYGPNWRTRIDSTINSTRAAGSPALPIWVTEWGLTTDNGRCLSDNYGWPLCLTYAQAATTLHGVITGMLSTYGSRLGAFYLYQVHDQKISGASSGREYYFGVLQNRHEPKGAYTTEAKSLLAAYHR